MRRSALTLLTLTIAGCGITDSGVTLRLQGTVTAQATGQPVVGAQVRLYPSFLQDPVATTTTDTQGRYSLSAKLDPCIENDFGVFVGASASGFDGHGTNLVCHSAL